PSLSLHAALPILTTSSSNRSGRSSLQARTAALPSCTAANTSYPGSRRKKSVTMLQNSVLSSAITRRTGRSTPSRLPRGRYSHSPRCAEILPVSGESGLVHHPFRQHAIPPGRIVQKDVRHSAHQPSILDDRASAHALVDSLRLLQQARISHSQHQPFAVGPPLPVDLKDLDAERLHGGSAQYGEHRRLAGPHLVGEGDGHRLPTRLRGPRQVPKDPKFRI